MSKVIKAREVADLLTDKSYKATYDETLKTILVPSQQLSIGPANEADELDFDLISYGYEPDEEEDEEAEGFHMACIYDEEESGEFTAENLTRAVIDYLEGN